MFPLQVSILCLNKILFLCFRSRQKGGHRSQSQERMLSTSWSQPGYPGGPGYPPHGSGYPYPQHQLEEANRRLMMHSSAAHLTNSGQQQLHASYTQQTAFGQSQAAGSSQFSQPGPAGQEMFSQSQHSNTSTLRKPVQSQQKPVLASEFTVAGKYLY